MMRYGAPPDQELVAWLEANGVPVGSGGFARNLPSRLGGPAPTGNFARTLPDPTTGRQLTQAEAAQFARPASGQQPQQGRNMNPLAALQGISFGPQGSYQDLLSQEQLKAAKQQGLLGFGGAMLANSGWSTQRPSLGAALGRGVMAGSQMQNQAQQQALQGELLKAKTEEARRLKAPDSPYTKIPIDKVTPESLEAFQMSVRAGAPDMTLLRFKDESGEAGARGQKIEGAMRDLGLSRAEATMFVDGYMKLTTDELGNRVLTDLVAASRGDPNASRLLPLAGGDPPPPSPTAPPIDPNALAFEPGKGTGAVAWLKGAWNKFPGQLPMMPVFQDAETAAQKLRYVQRDAVRALANSSRPPVIEQEALKALVADPMMFSQNPQVAKANMASFVDLLGQQYAADMADSRNQSLPVTVRNEVARRANEIQRIIRTIASPEAADALIGFYMNPAAPSGPSTQAHPPDIQALLEKWNPRPAANGGR